MSSFTFTPIGFIRSCFKEKFGTPRQPSLVPSARGRLELCPPYDRAEAWAGIEAYSHLWISFVFHHCIRDEPNLTVRPPRLGGNRKLGVFATRATYRPNPLGLSVVALERVETVRGRVTLHLAGIDLVEGTPVLDVKPYLPYVDSVPDARAGFAQTAPGREFEVCFEPQAEAALERFEPRWPGLRRLIEEVIALDPRPAYFRRGGRDKPFAVRLEGVKVRWRVEERVARVERIEPAPE